MKKDRPRNVGLPRAKPLRRKPDPKAFDILRDLELSVWALRNGLPLEAKRRTSWYSPTSSSE